LHVGDTGLHTTPWQVSNHPDWVSVVGVMFQSAPTTHGTANPWRNCASCMSRVALSPAGPMPSWRYRATNTMPPLGPMLTCTAHIRCGSNTQSSSGVAGMHFREKTATPELRPLPSPVQGAKEAFHPSAPALLIAESTRCTGIFTSCAITTCAVELGSHSHRVHSLVTLTVSTAMRAARPAERLAAPPLGQPPALRGARPRATSFLISKVLPDGGAGHGLPQPFPDRGPHRPVRFSDTAG
jgi:hypothetical protein